MLTRLLLAVVLLLGLAAPVLAQDATDDPTGTAGDDPSDGPSAAASDELSEEPSDGPGTSPSNCPSDDASGEPNDNTSSAPSDDASGESSDDPSDDPSDEPSDGSPDGGDGGTGEGGSDCENGSGEQDDEAAATFDVDRVAGDGRVATAIAVSQRAFPDGAPAVVLAAAAQFPDALAAAPLAAALEGPLLLVGDRVGTAVLDEVARLGAEEAVVVGAVGAVPLVVQDEVGLADVGVRRIAGDGRFDTAALVAREVAALTGGTDEAIVASGEAFADALAVAPVAAAQGIPILLTASDELPDDTRTALEELDIRRTLVIGGRNAVSDDVLDDLPDPDRVAGDDRYATAVAVAELGAERGRDLGTVFVATGRAFPDALAAGPAAAATGDGALLLLVDGRDEDHDGGGAYDFLADRDDDIDQLVVLGGESAVTPDVLDRLAQPGSAP